MKLWLIKRLAEFEYDLLLKAVVRAETEEQARQLAYVRDCLGCNDHPVNPSEYECVELTIDGDAGLICDERENG